MRRRIRLQRKHAERRHQIAQATGIILRGGSFIVSESVWRAIACRPGSELVQSFFGVPVRVSRHLPPGHVVAVERC